MTAVLSRTYGFVRSIVRSRFVWWKTCGIDAFTEEEYMTRNKRRRSGRGETEDIVLARGIVSFVRQELAKRVLRNLVARPADL